MSPELIIWPMIAVALATVAIYFPMIKARKAVVANKSVKASVYRHNIGEPEESLRFSNPIRNQYETPVLFYAVCLAAFVTDNASPVMIVLAFAFAIAKISHLYIHVTTNRLRHRMPAFGLSLLVLATMWIVLAISLTGLI